MHQGDRLRVTIEDIDENGNGIASLGGKTIRVIGAVPGDDVEISIEVRARGRRSRVYYGHIIDLITPSSDRVEPRCPYFGACGGCRYQNVKYDVQLRYKRRIIYRALEKWGLDAEVDDVIPSPSIWYYRNRMDYAISYNGEVGLRRYGTWWEIVDLMECHLLSEKTGILLDIMRHFMERRGIRGWDNMKHHGFLRYMVIREGKFTNERMINIVTYKGAFKFVDELIDSYRDLATSIVWSINPTISDISVGSEIRYLYGEDHLEEEIGGYRFYIHPNVFFQTNSYQTVNLVELVKRFSGSGSRLLDIYAGLGLFSIALSSEYDSILAIEMEEASVYSGKISMKLNDVYNIKYLMGRAEDMLWKVDSDIETIILDPPRPGISARVRKGIEALGPSRIVYVSCNPDTMIRDISMLKGYSIREGIKALDMFPHTPHVESVALLERD